MPALPDLHVLPVDTALSDAVLTLRVHESQRRFVGRIGDLLADAASRRTCEPMTVLLDRRPIGFYCLESNVRTVAGRDFPQPALGLRAFLIDRDHQGRGYGRRAVEALVADATQRYRHARLLVLAVDASNHAALALYRRAGFSPCQARYHDAPAVDQPLLLRSLAP